jgi:amino acid adenylation domain-containing protein
MRLEDYLRYTARRLPDKTALVAGEERLTYRELDERSDRLARALSSRGVRRGDRVVVFSDNSPETVVAVFAALKAGAVFSVVNPTTKLEKLTYILNNCRAAAVVTQQRLLSVAGPAVADAPSVLATVVAQPSKGAAPLDSASAARGGVTLADALASAPEGAPTPRAIDLDLAMILYTSGTTGHPKGVMMSHQNMVTACESIAGYLGNAESDVLLCVLPLSFGYGLNQVLTATKVGATVVLEKGFTFPALVVQRLRQERVTGFALVPTIAAILLGMNLQPGSFPDLRYVTNAAAAMSPAHLLRLQDLLPTTRIFSMYGQTECTRTLYLPPERLRTKPESVGMAIPNTEAYLVRDDGTRAGPGEVGELVVRGGHVMRGYWERPEETARALRPGELKWERVLYSGDLFRYDEEGDFYFVSRKDDVIKTRGEKVAPKEVEDVLYQLAGVSEAAVVGVPDPVIGLAVAAVIVPAEGASLTEAEVRKHCATHLEDFAVPKIVEFRPELPKSASGKIVRREIKIGASNSRGAEARATV